MADLLQRYADRILGCLSCFDRVIIWGTLVRVSHPAGLCQRLKELEVPLAQFAEFATALRDALEQHLRQLAKTEGVEIEYLRSARALRKEDRVQQILAQRGDHPGLVHIFEVVEPARVFEVRQGRDLNVGPAWNITNPHVLGRAVRNVPITKSRRGRRDRGGLPCAAR